jgi:hypothetical protein
VKINLNGNSVMLRCWIVYLDFKALPLSITKALTISMGSSKTTWEIHFDSIDGRYRYLN